MYKTATYQMWLWPVDGVHSHYDQGQQVEYEPALTSSGSGGSCGSISGERNDTPQDCLRKHVERNYRLSLSA